MAGETVEPLPDCAATRYASGACTPDGAIFDVVTTTSNGKEADRHPACFRHALAEVERHHASAGIARCEFVETDRKRRPA